MHCANTVIKNELYQIGEHVTALWKELNPVAMLMVCVSAKMVMHMWMRIAKHVIHIIRWKTVIVKVSFSKKIPK